jgi:hypothetical protein
LDEHLFTGRFDGGGLAFGLDFAPSILIVPSGGISGASFFFFETEVEEGEETTMPSINWDLLYTVRLALVVTL